MTARCSQAASSPYVVTTTVEPLPPPPSPSGVYILAVARSSRRALVFAGVVGALLTVGAVVATLWWLVAPVPARSATVWMNGAVPVCLGFTGLVGLLVLVGALNPWARSHPFTILPTRPV